jgi:hypothetical protein
MQALEIICRVSLEAGNLTFGRVEERVVLIQQVDVEVPKLEGAVFLRN